MAMTNTVQSPYLITSRRFPPDPEQLQPELSKMYIDIANVVNARVIGIFDKFQVVSGERWYNDVNPLNKRQGYRQVYTFGAIAAGATLTFDHNISGLVQVTSYWGDVITDTPDYRQIPYASATLVTNQIEANVTNTQVNIINGATAPNITSGIFVINYLLN